VVLNFPLVNGKINVLHAGPSVVSVARMRQSHRH
jgi:hypothetical protein